MCVLREVGTVGVYVDYVLGVMLSQSFLGVDAPRIVCVWRV